MRSIFFFFNSEWEIFYVSIKTASLIHFKTSRLFSPFFLMMLILEAFSSASFCF